MSDYEILQYFSYFQIIITKTSLQRFSLYFEYAEFFKHVLKYLCLWQLITRIFSCDFKGQQPQQDSPKKSIDKGPAPNPPLSGEAQLKYENDRLKLALAQR